MVNFLTTVEKPCPFCRERPCESDDHIFPDFLGGDRTIRSCKPCNDRFGHRSEGPVSKNLAPIIVFLSFSGLKPRKTIVHKRAWTDPASGYEYDIDSNRRTNITKPQLEKDAEGKIRRIIARDAKEVNKIAQSLVRKGLAKGFVHGRDEIGKGRPPLKEIHINIGAEMRQLTVKMCVGLAQLLVPEVEVVDIACRKFLMEDAPKQSAVRQVYPRYAALDALRPALAHTIYVEADPTCGRCYGVVQLFGAFQFYVPLHTRYTGTTFAALGVLSVTDWREEFSLREPLRLQEAPLGISVQEYEVGLEEFGHEFNHQVRQAFGEAIITTKASDIQSRQGFQVRIPLLWVEYAAEVQMELELIPDRTNEKDLAVSSDLRKWVFSPDSGQTRLRIFETFVERWNSGALDRALGINHVYVPEEIRPGIRLLFGEDFWCPVQSLRIHYRVLRQAWLGSVNLADCPGILNRVEHTLNTKITLTPNDIPTTRDLSWPTVNDVEAVEASNQNLITVERWDIDVSNLMFHGMRFERAEVG